MAEHLISKFYSCEERSLVGSTGINSSGDHSQIVDDYTENCNIHLARDGRSARELRCVLESSLRSDLSDAIHKMRKRR